MRRWRRYSRRIKAFKYLIYFNALIAVLRYKKTLASDFLPTKAQLAAMRFRDETIKGDQEAP